MKKDIKDYLHLYLVGNNCDTETGGCVNSLICNLNDKCQWPNGIEVYIFSPETLTNGWLEEAKKQLPSLQSSYQLTFDNYKKTIESGYLPILRPLPDLTDEELAHVGHFSHVPLHRDDLNYAIIRNSWSPEQTRYLLSKGFDLFGLIEAGLAIDKTKIIANEKR